MSRKGLSALAHADHINRMASVAGGLHHSRVCGHAKEITDVAAHSLRSLEVVQFNFNSDIPRDDVQTAGKSQNRGELRDALIGVLWLDCDEFVFDRNRERVHDSQYLFAAQIPMLQCDLNIRVFAQVCEKCFSHRYRAMLTTGTPYRKRREGFVLTLVALQHCL